MTDASAATRCWYSVVRRFVITTRTRKPNTVRGTSTTAPNPRRRRARKLMVGRGGACRPSRVSFVGAHASQPGREVGGSSTALLVHDAPPPPGGAERVAPRRDAARLEVGEPKASGARPFGGPGIAAHRLAEALQAEVTHHRLESLRE